MQPMATDSDTRVATTGARAPNSWGLGDGQAIPWEYAPADEQPVALLDRDDLARLGRRRVLPPLGGGQDTSLLLDRPHQSSVNSSGDR